MDSNFVKRNILVTGGSKGIGLETARKLISDGHNVAITYNSTKPEVEFLSIKCDISNKENVDKAFLEFEEKIGNVEILVANAGVNDDTLLPLMSSEKFESVIDTNVVGTFNTVKRASKSMLRKRFGKFIFLGSVVGLAGSPGQINYASSKAALVGMARSITRELGNRNITANVVAPGFIETDMTSSLKKEYVETITKAIPLGRIGNTKDVANLISWLSKEEANYISGAVIPIDGGLGMGH